MNHLGVNVLLQNGLRVDLKLFYIFRNFVIMYFMCNA